MDIIVVGGNVFDDVWFVCLYGVLSVGGEILKIIFSRGLDVGDRYVLVLGMFVD